MHRSKCKVTNTAQYTVSDRQSVQQLQTTADVQSVLLVLVRRGHLLDGPDDDLIKHLLPLVQPNASWGNWRHECGCDTSAVAVTGLRSRLLGGHNSGGVKSRVSVAKGMLVCSFFTTHVMTYWWRQHHMRLKLFGDLFLKLLKRFNSLLCCITSRKSLMKGTVHYVFYYPHTFNAIIDNVPGVRFLLGHSVYTSQ